MNNSVTRIPIADVTKAILDNFADQLEQILPPATNTGYVFLIVTPDANGGQDFSICSNYAPKEFLEVLELVAKDARTAYEQEEPK